MSSVPIAVFSPTNKMCFICSNENIFPNGAKSAFASPTIHYLIVKEDFFEQCTLYSVEPSLPLLISPAVRLPQGQWPPDDNNKVAAADQPSYRYSRLQIKGEAWEHTSYFCIKGASHGK